MRHRTHPTSLGVEGQDIAQEEPLPALKPARPPAQLRVGRCHLDGEAGLISRLGVLWGLGWLCPPPKSWNEQSLGGAPWPHPGSLRRPAWSPITKPHSTPAWLLQTKTQNQTP